MVDNTATHRLYPKKKDGTSRRLQLFSLAGLICLLLPVASLFLWIHAFNQGTDQPSRVSIYLGYFPAFLGVWSLTVIEMLLSVIAIVVCSISLNLRRTGWKIFNVAVIVGSSVMILWHLWGMM